MSRDSSRREFLGALGAAGMGIGAVKMGPERVEKRSPRETSAVLAVGFQLGIASYSLRNYSRTYAIQAIQAIGTPNVNVKSFHLPYDASPAELRAGRAEFEAAGLRIVGGGTVTMHVDTDEDVRSYFEYARLSGMPLMVIAPTRDTLPRIERFVQEYDIAVAIHNHGPTDEHFPGPQDALPVIADMDPRVGVCLDVGHTARTGIDVAEAAEMSGDRLLDLHIKDLADLTSAESQCAVGDGAIPVGRLFAALERIDYRGFVNLEYEIKPGNPLPGMQRSFAFMRGVVEGIDA
ncbi:MAG: sugar phosphate isomerase/epimerase family protein [Longimicrobiales bacterium]